MHIFEYLLGIRQNEGSAGYSSITVAPQAVSRFGYMKGSMDTPKGRASVGYEKRDGKICFVIDIPQGVSAHFEYGDQTLELHCGENRIELPENTN